MLLQCPWGFESLYSNAKRETYLVEVKGKSFYVWLPVHASRVDIVDDYITVVSLMDAIDDIKKWLGLEDTVIEVMPVDDCQIGDKDIVYYCPPHLTKEELTEYH